MNKGEGGERRKVIGEEDKRRERRRKEVRLGIADE